MDSSIELLQILQESLTEGLAATREVVVCGSLTAYFHWTDSMVYMNYAVPNSEPVCDDLDELILAFQALGRKPRFEFFPDLWPGLESMLLEARFESEMRAPLMALHRSEFVPKPFDGVELVSDADAHFSRRWARRLGWRIRTWRIRTNRRWTRFGTDGSV